MELIQDAVIGFVVGLTGGMFGIGGSVVLIPVLTELRGPNQHLYQAAAMIMNFFVSAPAVYQHWRARAIELMAIVRLVPLSIVFVAIGVGVSELRFFSGAGEAYLRGLFGLFLLGCGVTELSRSWKAALGGGLSPAGQSDAGRPVMSWRFASLIAAPAGFVSGLLGIGGGTVAVPLQRRFLRLPLTVAIANSTALVAATAVLGAIIKNYAYYVEAGSARQPVQLAAVLAPTAIAGSLLGSRWTHRLHSSLLRNLFVVLLLVAAARFILGAVNLSGGG